MMSLLLTELVSVSPILQCKGNKDWLAHAYGTESCMGSIKYGTQYIDAQISEQTQSSFSPPPPPPPVRLLHSLGKKQTEPNNTWCKS